MGCGGRTDHCYRLGDRLCKVSSFATGKLLGNNFREHLCIAQPQGQVIPLTLWVALPVGIPARHLSL
jgi:hypothetical protein